MKSNKLTMTVLATISILFCEEAKASEQCEGPGDYKRTASVCTCPEGTRKVLSELQPFQSVNGPPVPTIYNCVRASSSGARPTNPDRSSGTGSCSSTLLGQRMQCLSVVRTNDLGRGGYYIKSACPGSYNAAIITYDADNHCERDVVVVSRGNPAPVYSYFKAPRVVDAIEAEGLSVSNCYRKRHKGGPCE